MNQPSPMPAIADPEQSLCTRCGLCCDGTLFERARVLPEDDLSRLEAEGFVLLTVTAGMRFELPCHFHHDHICTVYQQWRPQICHTFRCALLRRLAAGEISLEEAGAQVERTVALADRIRAQLPVEAEERRRTLKQTMRAWQEDQAAAGVDVNRTFAALLLDCASLERLLDRHFRIVPENESEGLPTSSQDGQTFARQGGDDE